MPNRLLTSLTAAVLATLALAPVRSGADPAAPGAARIVSGEIAGARFAVALPPGAWNKRLLLLAHGYRPEGTPLVADLNPDRAAVKAVLGEGWMVATTSYRSNGLVVGDAIADLDALRAYVAQAYGEPERVVLEGDSMGGLIVTIMAERDKGPYDGAVAFDPTLYAKETNSRVGLTLLPRIPLLFVATLREAAQPKGYLTALVSRPAPVIQPALFLISREGHTNINQDERLEAFHALNAWIDGGAGALPRPINQAPYFDATIQPNPGPSTAVVNAPARALETRVVEVDPVYGSMLLDAQAADFAAAGIKPMTFCTLRASGAEYRVLYGRTYSDVKSGQWVAFPDADGRTALSRNFADAAATAHLKPGDTVTLAAVEPGALKLP